MSIIFVPRLDRPNDERDAHHRANEHACDPNREGDSRRNGGGIVVIGVFRAKKIASGPWLNSRALSPTVLRPPPRHSSQDPSVRARKPSSPGSDRGAGFPAEVIGVRCQVSGVSVLTACRLERVIWSWWFQTRGQALNAAVELLRSRRALLAHVEEGTRQLQSGDYVDLDEPGLRAFFDDVQAQGRQAYEATKKQQ